MSHPRLLSRAAWRLQTGPDKLDLITATALWIGMTTVLAVADSPVAAGLWIVLGSLELAGRYRANVSIAWRERRPKTVDVRAHCGCVHRWTWDDDNEAWTLSKVFEPVDTCLVEAR